MQWYRATHAPVFHCHPLVGDHTQNGGSAGRISLANNSLKILVSDSAREGGERAASRMSLHAPYLDAIQALPGDTPGEKYRWIAKEIQERAASTNNLEEILEYEKFPRILAPLIQVEGVRLQLKAIKRGHQKESKSTLSNYQAIAEALKSEDSEVVNRALRISEFFDGSNRTITNVTFFFDELFPIVSLKSRQKIVKALGCHLSKSSSLAEEFFSRMLATYGMEQALPLLPACSEPFILELVAQRKLRLTRRTVKLMFAKNPEFVVRYLKLLPPDTNPQYENISIHDYTDFLAKLVKKRLPAFAEIYEMHEERPIDVKLSKSSARSFWRKGKEYLERKPRLYIPLLPLKIIDHATMERIFPKLLPEKVQDFSTDVALNYLVHYPEEKKTSLLFESYKNLYGKDLLENRKNITPMLMIALPAEERGQLARRLIKENKDNPTYPMNYTMIRRCYLPSSEALAEIKVEIAKTPEMEDRAALLCQMIYNSKVNKDDASLLEILKYWQDRHKNEQSWLHFRVLTCLCKEHDLVNKSEAIWSVIFDIIKRMFVKNEFTSMSDVTLDIFTAALRFRFKNNLPIEPVIDMFVEIKINGYGSILTIFDDNADYERKCLEVAVALLEKKSESEKEPWKSRKSEILSNLVDSLYIFNHRYITISGKTNIEPLSIKNYPWLLKKIDSILTNKENEQYFIINTLENAFSTYEKDLYRRYWKDKKTDMADISMTDAYRNLRKDPKSVLENWENYLEASLKNVYLAGMRRFIKSTRWYKDLPIKLAEQCVQNVKEGKCSDSLCVLAVLLHGHSFTKFLEPLIPAEQRIDINQEEVKDEFLMTHFIIISMKASNPPVPLELVSRMCSSDYLSYALIALNNVCRRTSLTKVINFAKTLSGKRVSVRKHGIRVMHMVATLQQISDFLLNIWKTEEHYSIRQVIFEKASDIFRKEPSKLSWSVVEQIIAGLELKDVSLMNGLFAVVRTSPDEYVESCMRLVLEAIDRLAAEGLPAASVAKHTAGLIANITSTTCDVLPEEFMRDLLKKFLFNQEGHVAEATRMMVVYKYLDCDPPKLEKRLQTVTEILAQAVTSEWNVPHSKKSRYFPVNHAVHQLIDRLMLSRSYSASDRTIIEAFRETYNRVLTPQMDSISYLLLVFASERCAAAEPKEFGVRIGNVVGKLVETFTAYFMGCISSVLEYYLGSAKFNCLEIEEVKLSVMEGILEVETEEARFLCARMLTPVSQAHFDRHDAIVVSLSKCQQPAIKSILYNFINKTDASKF